MSRCGVCGGRQTHIEDVHAREEVVREAQLEAGLTQRFEERIKALEQQLADFIVAIN